MAEDPPQLNPQEQTLRDFCNDLIKRVNVHEFNGREAFEKHFDEQIANQLVDQVEPECITHYRQLALMFLFQEDPDHADLEAEKDKV